jgi:sugar phosphate isomerase/epimerase
MKFATCNEGFKDWSWPEVCKFAKETGYDGIEIAPFTFADRVSGLGPEARSEIKATAEQAGLAIVGLHWLLVKPEGLYLNHPEAAIRRKTADGLIDLVHFCADLGGKVMVFGSPKQRNVFSGLTFEQSWQLAKETFQLILPALAERDITLCFEPLSTQETDFINTAAQARKLIEEISHPNFRLLLDVKAMSSEAQAIPEIIRQNADLVAHFHANDANLGGPGFGEVDFAPILQTLQEVGYSGWVSVEAFDFTPGIETVARESLRYLKEKAPRA